MKRTCLFHVTGNCYPPFPVVHHTYRIWKELASGFDEYHVIARGERNVYIHCTDGNIHLHLLPRLISRMWVFFFLSWLLPLFVWRYRPTQLLVQCPVMGGVAAAVCSVIFKIPMMVELHGSHYFYRQWKGRFGVLFFYVYKTLTKITFAVANKIRCLSEHMRNSVLECYGASSYAKVVVIPNRVDLKLFRDVKKNYKINDPIKIVTVGSYIPIKNHISLIEALCLSDLDFVLTLIGDGPLGDKYRSVARQLHSEHKIVLTGRLPQKEIAALLIEQDIYIHYAHSEGVSRAILEAMAVALPIITAPVGFIGDVLTNGQDAIVLDNANDKCLNKAIKFYLASEATREMMGRVARSTIENRYEWEFVFNLYRRSIQSLVQ